MSDATSATAPFRRSSMLAAVASLSLQAASLAVFAVLSHFLIPTDLGAYRQILIIQSIVGAIASMGMPTAVLYFVGARADSAATVPIYRAMLAWLGASAILCGAIGAALTWLAGVIFHLHALSVAAPLTGFACALGMHMQYAGPFFISRGKSRWFVAFAIAQTLVLIGTSWTWVRIEPTLHSALSALIASGAIGTLVLGVVVRATVGGGSDNRAWSHELTGALKYGAPIAASSALYTLSYQVDHFVALRFLAPASYALYAAGAWQVPVGPLVQRGQADVLLPVLSSHHASGRTRDFWHTWNELVTPWGLLGALMFWAVFLSADDIIRVALGERFAAAAPVLRIYTLILPLRMAAFTAPLRAAGFTLLDVTACIAFGVVSLIVGIVGAHWFALTGPAMGVVAGYIAWVAVNVAGTARILKVPVSLMLPIRRMGLSWIGTGLAGILPWAVSRALAPNPGLARVTLFLGAYSIIVGGSLFVTTVIGRRRSAGVRLS